MTRWHVRSLVRQLWPAGVVLLFALGLAVLAVMTCGCTPAARQAQAVAADAMARTINAAVPQLVGDYQREGDAVIDAAPTPDEARAAVAQVRVRWAPVWDAIDAFAAAHDAWASAIESGGTPGLAEIRGAWCDVRHAMAPRATLPDFPGAPCP